MRQLPDDGLDDFDPYHKWLGIPEKNRPPTYYQLLGISPREDDREVIEAAAKRQTKFVREFLGGPHHKYATAILFQIDQARFTILDDKARRRYDKKLKPTGKRRFAIVNLIRTIVPSHRHTESGGLSRGFFGNLMATIIPNRVTTESSGLARQFFGIMATIIGGFIVMYFVVFYFPWTREVQQPQQSRSSPIVPNQSNVGLQGQPSQQQQEFDKALVDCNEAIRRNPNDAAGYHQRAFLWAKKHAYEAAIADCDNAIRLNSNDGYAYGLRGFAWHEMKNYDKALADYDDALRLNPKDADLIRRRGLSLAAKREASKQRSLGSQGQSPQQQGQLTRQERDKVLKIVEEANAALEAINRGNASMKVLAYEKAVAEYTEAIRLSPKNEMAFYRRSAAWTNRREIDNAFADLNEAIRLQPNFPDAFQSRGMLWTQKREFSKALSDYDQAIRLNPNVAIVYRFRGEVFAATGEFDKAFADYNQSIRLNPNDGRVYDDRGFAWVAKRDYDRALADSNEAIRLNSKDGYAYSLRGTVWHNTKNYDKALADFNEAIRLSSGDGYAYGRRGGLWHDLKDYDKALADFDESVRLIPNDAELVRRRGLSLAAKQEASKRRSPYKPAR